MLLFSHKAILIFARILHMYVELGYLYLSTGYTI